MDRRSAKYDYNFLSTVFSYNPEDGHLRWIVDWSRNGRVKAGKVAGGLHPDGYVSVTYLGVQYFVHCVAWLLMKKELPPTYLDIDHKDRNRANNKWDNLRLLSPSLNSHNRKAKGISFDKNRKMWNAQLMVAGKMHWLGRHRTETEAMIARLEAEKRLIVFPAATPSGRVRLLKRSA